jgi:AAHS family 4-hydroxybenzoate transporter-like MFS transporter
VKIVRVAESAVRVSDPEELHIVDPQLTNIASIIDRTPLGIYRTGILIVCFLVVLMDGFDTLTIGFAAPSISLSLGIPVTSFGSVFSAGLLGAVLGACIMGPMADRLGRRRMLAGAVVTFSLVSLLTPHVHDLSGLLICRFLTGLGLGGAIPNVLALSSEYAPQRIRGLLTGILFAGMPAGGVVGAVASAHLMPLFGWPVLFYLGGTIPLLLAAAILCGLPESPQFVLRRPDGQRKMQMIARRIAPDIPINTRFYVDIEEKVHWLPVWHLFEHGRTRPTLLLWIASFMCFAMLIVVVLWTPALLHGAAVDETYAAWVVGLFSLGSLAGTALGGRLIDRFDPYVVLPILFVAAALALGPMGHAVGSVAALGLLAALSGFCLGAASASLLSAAVLIYPSITRATGIGWAIALGRMGQVTAPLIVGALLAAGLPLNWIFLCCAVPALCAAGATILLRWSGFSPAI